MASLAVEKLHDTELSSAPILRELQNFFDATQRRAFELFNKRGAWPGADLDDWLRAEREIAWVPQAELLEDEKEIRIQVATPGLEPKQIHVTALSESIIVKGEATPNMRVATTLYSSASSAKKPSSGGSTWTIA